MTAAVPGIRYAAELPATADLVVVGGGVVGCATLFFAARAGLRAVLLERRAALATLTTPVSTGAFRIMTSAGGGRQVIDMIVGRLDPSTHPLRPDRPMDEREFDIL